MTNSLMNKEQILPGQLWKSRQTIDGKNHEFILILSVKPSGSVEPDLKFILFTYYKQFVEDKWVPTPNNTICEIPQFDINKLYFLIAE